MTVHIHCILSWEGKQWVLSHNYNTEPNDWNNSWESPWDWSTYSANLLSAFFREWFSNRFPYNQRRKHLAKLFLSSAQLHTWCLSLLRTCEACLHSCFSRRKLNWSTFMHHSISRMGIWIFILAYSMRSCHTEPSKENPTSGGLCCSCHTLNKWLW